MSKRTHTPRTATPLGPLSRRALLRGTAGGIVIGLCPLEAMFDDNGVAYAQGVGTPKRFGLMLMGNGWPQPMGSNGGAPFIPTNVGSGFTLSEPMNTVSPAAKQHLRLFTALRHTNAPSDFHPQCAAYAVTGRGVSGNPGADSPTALGPSADFIAQTRIGAGTAISNLRMQVTAMGNGFTSGTGVNDRASFDMSGNPQSFILSAQTAFSTVFGNFVPSASGGTSAKPTPDPRLAEKGSILDFVKQDTQRVRERVGQADRHRLDAHLESVRELERSIQDSSGASTGGTGALAGCAVPTLGSVATTPAKAEQMLSLIAMAIACDRTRVFNLMITKNSSYENMGFLGINDQWHLIAHASRNGDFSRVNKVVQWHIGLASKLCEKLSGIAEGAGTVLDNTIFTLTAEHGSAGHSAGGITHFVFGGKNMLAGDFHRRGSGENSARVLNSMLKAVGVNDAAMGGDSGTLPLS